jgi:hypothetical protein
MSLADDLREAVLLANAETTDIQPKVKHEAYLGETGDGDKLFAAPVFRDALVDWKQKMVRTVDGTLTVSRAAVTFLDPDLKVDENDRITLPDGTVGPILDMAGPYASKTATNPVLTEVFLG